MNSKIPTKFEDRISKVKQTRSLGILYRLRDRLLLPSDGSDTNLANDTTTVLAKKYTRRTEKNVQCVERVRMLAMSVCSFDRLFSAYHGSLTKLEISGSRKLRPKYFSAVKPVPVLYGLVAENGQFQKSFEQFKKEFWQIC